MNFSRSRGIPPYTANCLDSAIPSAFSAFRKSYGPRLCKDAFTLNKWKTFYVQEYHFYIQETHVTELCAQIRRFGICHSRCAPIILSNECELHSHSLSLTFNTFFICNAWGNLNLMTFLIYLCPVKVKQKPHDIELIWSITSKTKQKSIWYRVYVYMDTKPCVLQLFTVLLYYVEPVTLWLKKVTSWVWVSRW